MEKNKKIIVCLAGKNEIGVYGLQLLIRYLGKENIRVICNSTDEGFDTWQPSLLKAAIESEVQVTSLEDCYDIDNLVFLSLEFNKIVDPNKFKDATLFNIHFSNLPSYKGMYTSAMPLLNGEVKSGVTLHEIDSGIDTGNIIDKIIFEIESEDTAKDLYIKYLYHSKSLLERNLSNIISGNISSKPQSSIGSSYYSSKSIDYKNLKVNLNATAKEIKNQIKAFTFPEYQVPKIHGYYVNFVEILNEKSVEKSGSLLKFEKTKIFISSLDYNMILYIDLNAELFKSVTSNNMSKVLDCIEFGANINLRNGRGWTPLIIASYNGAVDLIKVLIKSGADINKSSYKGTTPLMYAMAHYEKSKDRSAFDMLIEFGADKELRDIRNYSIDDHAIERGILGLYN